MKERLLKVLACPQCKGESLSLHQIQTSRDDEILEGQIRCDGCRALYPISKGIPRFVPIENYAASFGFQWNKFKREQLDSATKATLSRLRLLSETQWPEDWFRGKWVLDAGCGAGRFLEVAAKLGAEIVGVDLSLSVEGTQKTLGHHPNLHLVQGSIFDLPFKSGAFDACYCIGVLQHTPDPLRATSSLPRILKPGGRLAVTIYEKRRFSTLHSKYLIRKLTKLLPDRTLLKIIQVLMPILFPLTNILFRIPVAGRFFRFLIPVANYVEMKELSFSQRYQLAILDTFDMLAPAFDFPQKEGPVREILQNAGISAIQRLRNPGLNLTGEKAA